jgi:hypothetical protein
MKTTANKKDEKGTASNSNQSEENTTDAGKLSDYPDGNLDEDGLDADTIPGNQTDQPTVEKSVDEATDPSKLSDL